MKRNKNGFTLAEILIALAVIGIISAITLPSLTKLKNQDGAVLGRAIEQLELGCQNIIQEYNLEQAGAAASQTLLGTTEPSSGYSFSESSLAASVRAEKNDEAYAFAKVTGEYKTSNYNKNAADKLDSTIMKITIDTNGFKNKPNTNGVDQFNFELKNNGRLIPADEEAEKMVESGFKSGLTK